MRRLLVGIAVFAAVTACIGEALEPLPLAVTIQATPSTIATTDSVSIIVHAQGGSLVGIETDYGDGTVDSFSTAGARTAQVTFRHRYSVAGTYQVTATATDAVAGEKAASVQVNVQ